MSVLQSVRILANERLDKVDFDRIQEFVCADLQALQKYFNTDENFVVSGFNASGLGTNTLSIAVAQAMAIYGSNNGSFYIGASSLNALTTSTLTPSATNYVEIKLETDTGGADSRTFWDQTAAGGLGGEFSQIIDTFTFQKATLQINSAAFTGDVTKLPICEVDVNGSGIITSIRDARNRFFRLGRRGDATYSFPWVSRTEPTSNSFTGADKDLNSLKDWIDAIMSALKEIKGTTYWYELAPVDLGGGFRNTGLSILVGNTLSAKFAWDGANLNITDDNGLPSSTDVLVYLRAFDLTTDIALTRETIALADDEVLWIELPNPAIINQTYDGVGFTSSNYRVNSRGSVPLDSDTYWLAYRSGTRIYLRGLGELEAGEEKQVNDETTTILRTFLGFDPETATSVPYPYLPDPSCVVNLYTNNDSLVQAIGINTENINDLCAIIKNNVYDEPLDVIAGIPVNDNEIQGPLAPGATLTLPNDSRDANAIELYTVGDGTLEVYLNGVVQILGRDWQEIGSPGNLSTQITMLRNLVVGDEVHFRIDTTGGIRIINGGSQSLQGAYDVGNTIVTTYNRPMQVSGGGIAGTDEVQLITFGGKAPEYGDLVLSHNGNNTSALPFNSTNTDVQNALNALPSLSSVVVTGNYTSGFTINYTGADGQQNQPLLVEVSNTYHDFPFLASPNETFRVTYSPTLAVLLSNPLDAEHTFAAATPAITGAPSSSALGDIAGTGIIYASGAAEFIEYVDPSANPHTTGTLRFKFQVPSITSPSANNTLVNLINVGLVNTVEVIADTSTNIVTAIIRDNTGVIVATLTTIAFISAGVTYELEINWDYTAGDYALYRDGILDATALVVGAGPAGAARVPDKIQIGNISGTNTDNFIVDDIQLFDLEIHAPTVAGPIFTVEVPRFVEATQINTNITASIEGALPSVSKVAEFFGDIKVTGLIDPKGMVFEAQVSNPIDPADDGIYVNSAHDLIQKRGNSLPEVNLTQVALGNVSSTAVEIPFVNNTGSTLVKGTPVRVNASGELDVIDVSVESESFSAFGVIKQDISDGEEGVVAQHGRLTELTGSFNFGDVLYVDTLGGLTNIKPSIGVGGFTAGDFVIRVGVVAKNLLLGSNKDLIVSVNVVGQL